MQVALPYNIYLLLERKLGREEAQTVGKAIEVSLSAINEHAENIALQKKVEIKEELSQELASKGDLSLVKTELMGEMKALRIELENKIDKVEFKLNTKLNFLIILMIIALTLMNPVVADIIRSWIK